MTKKPKRGGARAGAGRPPVADPMRSLTVMLPGAVIDWVKHVAVQSDTSAGDVVRVALAHLASDPAAALKIISG